MRHPSDPQDIALPRSFTAGYGRGLDRGLSLGDADRVVGTSAGSVVATALLAGNLTRVYRELQVLSKVPALVSALAPTSEPVPSQQRALDLFVEAVDGEAATARSIGHAALAAVTPPPAFLRRNIAVLAGGRRWPTPALQLSCVDAHSGERCVITHRTGVSAAAAAAASSAVPGVFSPQPIGDRKCMDGGCCGTGLHLDLLGGARRALVLGLTDGRELTGGMMTIAPGSIRKELDDLAATGTIVEFRVPETVDPNELMSPAAVPKAMAMAARQAASDHDELRAFWV